MPQLTWCGQINNFFFLKATENPCLVGRKEPFRKGKVPYLPELGFTLVWTGQGAGWHRSKNRPLLTAFSWDLKTSVEETSWPWLGSFGDLAHYTACACGSKLSSLSAYLAQAHEDWRGSRQRRTGGCRVAGGKLWCPPGQWQSQWLGFRGRRRHPGSPTAGGRSVALRSLQDRVLREQAQWTYGCWGKG